MNKYIKEFLHRGALFASCGPIIAGLVYWIIELAGEKVSLSGGQILLAIISISLVAFVHAGSSIFHQIEHFSPLKSAFLQLISLYVVYVGAYLLNSWIPLKIEVILIFTAIFIVTYLLIWLIVFIITKSSLKELNKSLK